MDSTFWVLLVAIFGAVALPFWVYFAFRPATRRPLVRERVESQGILPEEWKFVHRHHCLPVDCPRLVGDQQAQPRDAECEVCAALAMERYWQQAALPMEPRRRRMPRLTLCVGLLLQGLGVLLGRLGREILGGALVVAGLALLLAGFSIRRSRHPVLRR